MQRLVIYILLVATLASSGCGLCKKPKRGMILRGDWAVEVNRTPWIGCPPSVGCEGTTCSDDEESCAQDNSRKTLSSWFKHGSAKDELPRGKRGFRIACGKRRGCRSDAPCKTSPVCGTFFDMDKPNPVIIAMMRQGQLPIPTEVPGVVELVAGSVTGNVNTGAVNAVNTGAPHQSLAIPGTVLPPGGSLPAGGVVVAGGAVMRPCGMIPQCNVSAPCRTHPQCGAVVPAAMLQQNTVAGFVNPAMGQIVHGLTMSGSPQVGYPPIGYTTSGYSPGFPQHIATGSAGASEIVATSQEIPEQPDITTERVPMPSPRFHSVPTKPTFQRSQGTTQASQSTAAPAADSRASPAAVQQAYLKGMIAAMRQQQQQQILATQQATAAAPTYTATAQTEPAASPKPAKLIQQVSYLDIQ